MVHEIRHIVFKPADLKKAVDVYRKKTRDFLPAGIVDIEGIAANGMIRVGVQMAYGRTRQKAQFVIAANDLIKILIHACKDLGIPVPRRGRKTISPSSRQVVLNIELGAADLIEKNEVDLTNGRAASAQPAANRVAANA